MSISQAKASGGTGLYASIRWIFSSIVLITLCVISFAQKGAADCWDDPWVCNERDIGCFHPDWMKDLDGSLLISQVSIPATHETMASESGGAFVICQSVKDLRKQLDAGIRALLSINGPRKRNLEK